MPVRKSSQKFTGAPDGYGGKNFAKNKFDFHGGGGEIGTGISQSSHEVRPHGPHESGPASSANITTAPDPTTSHHIAL